MASWTHHAFVDAYGDTGLKTEKEGTSVFFIIAAVLVRQHSLDGVRAGVERIRSARFGGGELKSKKVGGDAERRIEILEELAGLDFRVHADAIDKREIDPDSGLIYKRSFLKFLHRQLYRKLVLAFPDIRIVADEHGSEEFMRGFQAYMGKRNPPDLFPRAAFDFADSEREPLVQLADFMAGSLAHVIDPGKSPAGSQRILNAVREKVLTVDEWPPQRRLYSQVPGETAASPLDSLVQRVCLNRALVFIEENQNSADPQIRYQVSAIRYLVLYSRFEDPERYVPTKLLLRILREGGARSMNEQFFRSSVIAKLRDAGVIISSGPNGYKLPVSAADLAAFVNTSCGIILPMLDRLKRARDQLLLASEGELDILDHIESLELKQLCKDAHERAG